MVHVDSFKLMFTGDYTYHHTLTINLDINYTAIDMK